MYYRRRNPVVEIEQVAGETTPREAWWGCYIDRRRCGSGREVNRPRWSGKDTGVDSAVAARLVEASWTDSVAAS